MFIELWYEGWSVSVCFRRAELYVIISKHQNTLLNLLVSTNKVHLPLSRVGKIFKSHEASKIEHDPRSKNQD